MRTKKGALAAILTLAMGAGSAVAQIQIDKRRPASPAGQVRIDDSFGSIRVIGADVKEVAVSGRLAAGAEGLDIDGDRQEISIEVRTPDAWSYGSEDDSDYRSDLEVRVPKGSSIEARSLNASITISGVEGTLNVETVNGGISISGNPKSVEVNGVTGKIEITAAGAEMQVENVSGPVILRGAARSAEVTTTSGAIDVSGKDLERVELKTTAGEARLEGSFKGDGGVSIENFSGNVQLVVPADVAARFKLSTFSGQIESAMGPKPTRNLRRLPYTELRFSTAETDFDVSVETFSGNISLRKIGEGKPGAAAAPAKKERTE
jgi:DUF4097 and DUF4098 domain-containing protein YvlB